MNGVCANGLEVHDLRKRKEEERNKKRDIMFTVKAS